MEAGWGQVLVPRVLALLNGLMAEVRGLPGWGGDSYCRYGVTNPSVPPPHTAAERISIIRGGP